MRGNGPYRVVWADRGDTVGDRFDIPQKAQAVSEALELKRFIAVPIKVVDAKDRCVLTVEPVAK